MKRYVLQWLRWNSREGRNKWEVYQGAAYDTLAEAVAAYKALPIKADFRIAEAYTVVRYKEIRLQSLEK